MLKPAILYVQVGKEGGSAFESLTSGLKAVAGRFTAPISGDEESNHSAIAEGTGSDPSTIDKAGNKVRLPFFAPQPRPRSMHSKDVGMKI